MRDNQKLSWGFLYICCHKLTKTKTMTLKKNIKNFSMEDAKGIIPASAIVIDNDVLIFEDFRQLELTNEALHLGFLAYCYCRKGSATFQLNSRTVEMKSGDLYLSVGQHVFNKETVSDDFEAIIVLISQRFMQDSISGLYQLWSHLLFLYDNPILSLKEDEREWVEASFDYIKMRFARTSHHFLHESTAALIRLFYFDVCDLLSRRSQEIKQKHPGGYGIFEKFIHLLMENARKERSVAWYSDRLYITPKYLSEVVKNVSGQTAGQWITHFVVLETKQLLSNTSLSIKEIAQQLNFANQSFLGKYFKNATGISPSEFRNE